MKHLVFHQEGVYWIAPRRGLSEKLLDTKTARFCGELFIGYKPEGFIAKKLKT
jgi:hypothetical protein